MVGDADFRLCTKKAADRDQSPFPHLPREFPHKYSAPNISPIKKQRKIASPGDWHGHCQMERSDKSSLWHLPAGSPIGVIFLLRLVCWCRPHQIGMFQLSGTYLISPLSVGDRTQDVNSVSEGPVDGGVLSVRCYI